MRYMKRILSGLILAIFTFSLCIVPALADNGVEPKQKSSISKMALIWL